MSKLRKILAEEGLLKRAAKMGKWEEMVTDTWPDGRQTHYLIALPGKYGGIYVGWIKPGTTRSGEQGVNWYVYEKSWKDWNPRKHFPLLRKKFRDYFDKGTFVKVKDSKDAERVAKGLRDDVMRALEPYAIDPNAAVVDENAPPPSAEAMERALSRIPGIKFSRADKYGQKANWTTEKTNAKAMSEMVRLLKAEGFVNPQKGKFMGSTETGVSLDYPLGGRVFARFETTTSYGKPTTYASVRAEHNL